MRSQAKFKHIAKVNEEKSARSIAATRVNLSHDMVLTGPDEENLAKSLRRARQDPSKQIPAQHTRKFVLPDAFKVNSKGEPWILSDSGEEDPERIIILSSPMLQKTVQNADFFLIDGTFDICPSIYYQLMTIHAICGEVGKNDNKKPVIQPLVFALLPKKNAETYKRFLVELNQKIGMNPKTFLMDFEIGLSKTIREIWPDSDIAYCFFHLEQSLWRKVQELKGNAIANYKAQGHNFNNLVTAIGGTAFVPPEMVPEAFKKICQRFKDDSEDYKVFSEYFYKNYVGEDQPDGSQKAPPFLVDEWNVYHRTLAFQPRTNNAVEGWHSGMKKIFNCRKPSLEKFCKKMHEVDDRVRSRLEQLSLGRGKSSYRSKVSQNSQDNILKIVQNFDHHEIVDYCLKIGKMMKMV